MDPQINVPEIDCPAPPVPPFPIPEPARNKPRPPRNLVLCLDGTANQFSSMNTNVIKLFSVLDISPGYEAGGQMAYYDSGVGTYLPVGHSSWPHVRQQLAKTLDMAVAWNFGDHVKNAYKWLMDYYQPGDKIFLFGFSRGAYAVRALAGMIQKVGLLPAGCHSQIPLAYDVYKSPSRVSRRGNFESADNLARRYRGIFGISREVNVHFIGVWDTVSSLGGLSAPDLPFANAVERVKYFRQALALDECRVKFQPEYRVPSRPLDTYDPLDGIVRFKEVWFLGVHTSVGGSCDPDDGPSLASVPFRWMLSEAVECGLRTGPIGILRTYALMAIPTVRHYISRNLPYVSGLLHHTILPLGATSDRDLCDGIRDEFKDWHQENIVHLAAQYDTSLSLDSHEAAAGLPMTDDLLTEKHESLKGIGYLTMDYVVPLLECRSYKLNDEQTEYKLLRHRRTHAGDGRYIQHDQKIHRSVLKRLLFDQAVKLNHVSAPISDPPYKAYDPIKSHVPPMSGAKGTNYWDYPRRGADVEWTTLMAPENRGLELWEVD